MGSRVERIAVRGGYDLWSRFYSEQASTLVALDRRHSMRHLRPLPGERILDAGCGTGAHLQFMIELGAQPVGLDFSAGMLAVARGADSRVPLVQADLDQNLPIHGPVFDAVLCTLVSEHLHDLPRFFSNIYGVLRRGGRLVFSAFHPQMAAAGVEANFEIDGTEYRLGAEPHTQVDFLDAMAAAGFQSARWCEYTVDEDFVAEIPRSKKHLGKAFLLMIEGER